MAIFRRIANLFSRSKIDLEIQDELHSHIEMRIEDNIANGMSPEAARRDALLKFGNPVAMQEKVAHMDAALGLDTFFRDIRYALRTLWRSKGFTAVAVGSLALGIGATTSVFSVIYAALMNPYPYPAAARIVRLALDTKTKSGFLANLDGPQVERLQKLRSAESVIAMDYHAMILTGHSIPENVDAIGLISNGFNDLGVPPLLGRGLLPSDAPEGQDSLPVTVLSYKFWQKHFFGDPTVLGRTLQLNRKSYTIVGVTAPRFTWYNADVYLPLKLAQDSNSTYIVDILLKRGVTYAGADAELEPLLDRFAKEMPTIFPEHFKVKVEGLNDWVVKSIGGTLYFLLAAVGLLLAVGCGNVSILLLARGVARRHELAVRAAVGASRLRIVRQLLTESLLLALSGAAFGVLLAYGILAGIKALLPRYAFSLEVVIGINFPVLAFSICLALGTGVLFGLWPALQLSRPQASRMVLSGTRRFAGSLHGRKVHDALIAGQIALTLLLLVGAGSAVEGYKQLRNTPLGYDPHNVMSVGIPLHENSYTTWAARAAYFEQLRLKVAETRGVTMAAISTNATPPHNGWNSRFEVRGGSTTESQMGSVNAISPDYFATLRIPVLQGRVWSEAENRTGAHVVVINETLARRYFPNGSAIGHLIRIPALEKPPPTILIPADLANSWLQIVGVAGDARNDGLNNSIAPAVYIPYTLYLLQGTQILVKSDVSPLTLLHAIKEQLSAVDQDQQTYGENQDLNSWIADDPTWQQGHLVSWLFGIFAMVALALAAVGLYSVVSYSVSQRTNEFGIRLALGAQRSDVFGIVYRSVALSLGGGVSVGIVLAVALSKVLAHWVQGSSRDPLIILCVTLLLGLVAIIACTIPARRAAYVDPAVALRD